MKMTITKEQTKKFLIIYHRLHRDNPISNTQDLMSYIHKVGCIQYDPINVIAYNSHLVLQSRYTGYSSDILDKLLYEDCQLIDGWDKNLSIYPTANHVYYSPYRNDSLRYYSRLSDTVHDLIPTLKTRIEREGPLASIDVKDSPTIDWAWAPTKAVRAALDYMFHKGDIYVHHKINTRKYYDLIEHHPSMIPGEDAFENEADYHDWHVSQRIGGVGMLPALKDTYGFIAVHDLTAKARRAAVNRLLAEGAITQIEIEDIETPYFIRTQDVDLLKRLSDYEDDQPKAHIIAALDNLIWDRDMIQELFDYRYRWEVYVPESKREYGYYVLPVLYGYDFIGRIIMKYNRKEDCLEIHNWYFEKGIKASDVPAEPFAEMLSEFVRFLGAGNIRVLDDARHRSFVRKAIARSKRFK